MWEHGAALGKGGFASLESPSIYQQQIDYVARTDGQPVYVGFAVPGLGTSTTGWLIQKFTYTTINSVDFLATRQSAVGAWSDRAALSYS